MPEWQGKNIWIEWKQIREWKRKKYVNWWEPDAWNRAGLRFYHALTDGVADQGRRTVKLKLLHDPGSMGDSGVEADAQEGCDLLGRLTLGNQLENLTLPESQRVRRDAVFRDARRHNGPGDVGT